MGLKRSLALHDALPAARNRFGPGKGLEGIRGYASAGVWDYEQQGVRYASAGVCALVTVSASDLDFRECEIMSRGGLPLQGCVGYSMGVGEGRSASCRCACVLVMIEVFTYCKKGVG